ncbi:MAG TPA: GNAT family N-acetyltransferase [Balneolales bacterium]|nr:GNAT family N-acetyltransferase [Balneolales bacterium]
MVNIVEASEKDYQAIRWTTNQDWSDAFGKASTEAQTGYMLEMMYGITSLMKQPRDKRQKVCLAADDTRYLGYATYETGYRGLSKTKIHKIFILPSEQDTGIEKLLIDKVSKIARENNNHILVLNVDRGDPALAMYEKLGFCKTGCENVLIGISLLMEDYIMEKALFTDQYN